MFDFGDDHRERFFTWCDDVVQACLDREGAVFKAWWPRKTREGGYELVLELTAGDGMPLKISETIPETYHELLEQEYFIDHPPDRD
jgi:hypothetical protein